VLAGGFQLPQTHTPKVGQQPFISTHQLSSNDGSLLSKVAQQALKPSSSVDLMPNNKNAVGGGRVRSLNQRIEYHLEGGANGNAGANQLININTS
jgi:hypothetical protein